MRLARGGYIAIVTGSRHGAPAGTVGFVRRALDEFDRQFGYIEMVIQGGCKPADGGDPPSVDQLAAQWAMARERAFLTYPAPWTRWEELELPSRAAAGPHRNSWMHDVACVLAPNARNRVCLAFPGGTGTAGMVKTAAERGTRVMRYEGLQGPLGLWRWKEVAP